MGDSGANKFLWYV